MSIICSLSSGSICRCEEKDHWIQHLKTQLNRLQSERLALKAANLLLCEHLEGSTQDLTAQLVSKQIEVHTLRGTCHAMSSQVMDCEERTATLQEELVKKEELLQIMSASSWPLELTPGMDVQGSVKHTHDISIQTSPRPAVVERSESMDSWPLSSSTETLPFPSEVQELRHTVQVLKEQLEEWQSVPNSPAHVSSPTWSMPCASLADVLDLHTKLQRPTDSSIGYTDQSSPRSTLSPLIPRNSLSSVNSTCLEDQVLHAVLTSELFAAEGIERHSISLEHAGAVQEVHMMRDWALQRHGILLRMLRHLEELETDGRDHLIDLEKFHRATFHNEQHLRPRELPAERHPLLPADRLGWRTTLADAEATGRSTGDLEEEGGRLAFATDYGRCRRSAAAAYPLRELEAVERNAVNQPEQASWDLLQGDQDRAGRPGSRASSTASSVGESLGSPALEEPPAIRFPPNQEVIHQDSCVGQSRTAVQRLAQRHGHAFRLLVHQESCERARLVWLSDSQRTQSVYRTLLNSQLSHGYLAEDICVEEAKARSMLEQLFDEELLACLGALAKRRCQVKVCELWENEQWSFFVGWSPGRPHFSDSAGRTHLDWAHFDSFVAREGLCWSSEGWELDLSSPTDGEGWQYRPVVPLPAFHSLPWLGAPHRRRRWVRVCEPRPFPKTLAGATPSR